MGTPENRSLYNRDKLRYPSDLTDAEWRHICPLIPPAKRGGGKRRVDMRDVVNGLMYVLTVRTEGDQSPACMTLPVAELDGLLFALVSWQVRDRENRVNCPPL